MRTTIQITVDDEVKDALTMYAMNRGMQTPSWLLRIALHEYLRRHKPQEQTPWADVIRSMIEG